jgi:hypothetical protein
MFLSVCILPDIKWPSLDFSAQTGRLQAQPQEGFLMSLGCQSAAIPALNVKKGDFFAGRA